MGKLSSLIWGLALGAGLMYFYDPQNGNRRKAMVRDQMIRFQNKSDDALNTAVNDLRNRVRGILAEGMAMVSGEQVPDDVLGERVNSRLGFLTRHPGAVQATVQNGTAMLSGDVLSDEVDNLVKGIEHVRGIHQVDNRLRVHQDAGNIPQLQGEGWLPGQNAMWAPSTRLLVGVGAGYLLLYSMVRGGIVGFFARMAGIGLGARALTNMNMRQMTGMSQEGVIHLRKSMQINAPVHDVYLLWSNFENFPRFMSNVESIHTTGSDRSHWVVKGPAGSKVEFDAIETENIPDQMIAWETTPDSQVKHQGQVRFRDTGQNHTQVNVDMSYTPPAGVAGAAVAALFGKDPKSQMDDDLVRMKSLLEEGKTTARSKTVRRDEVMPVTGRGGRPGNTRSEMTRPEDQSNLGGSIREGESSQGGRGNDVSGIAGNSSLEEDTGTGGDQNNDMGGSPMVPPGL